MSEHLETPPPSSSSQRSRRALLLGSATAGIGVLAAPLTSSARTISVQGATGPTGPRGATGSIGARGATGVTGSGGATGGAGSAGVPGASGGTGTPGNNGATGQAGATGPMGAAFDAVFVSSADELVAFDRDHVTVLMGCPTGSVAIGGGTTAFPDDYMLHSHYAFPNGDPQPAAWLRTYITSSTPPHPTGKHFAICLQLPA